MQNLSTTYMGLKLKSPVVVSSCGLTRSLENIRKAEMAGAGAVVLKSLFEEQILGEISHIDNYSDYPEAADYVKNYVTENKLNEYLTLISDAKAKCDIPIIASICCVYGGEWVEFARRIEQAGADAIELNIFMLPTDKEVSSEEIENQYLDTISAVSDSISIPMAVKIGSHFTNTLAMVKQIYYRNVKGIVMFNRFYEPDIDIEQMKITSADVFSSPTEFRTTLRWVAMTSGELPLIDIAASTGIHDADSAIKALLAGARVTQVCTTVYKNGFDAITAINSGISGWMARHGFCNISDFSGIMNYSNISNPVAYERSQFMKYFASKN